MKRPSDKTIGNIAEVVFWVILAAPLVVVVWNIFQQSVLHGGWFFGIIQPLGVLAMMGIFLWATTRRHGGKDDSER